MNRRRVICGVALLILIFPLLVFLFIPKEQIFKVARTALARQGYTLAAERLDTTFPLGITAHDVSVSSARGPLVFCDRLTVSPDLLKLFTGTLAVSADATVGAGRITVQWRKGRTQGFSIDFSGLLLEDIPFFRTVAGTTARGVAQGEVRLSGPPSRMNGTIRIEVAKAGFADLKIGEMPLPAVTDETIQGMLQVTNGQGQLESLTLDGGGLYARLRGAIPLTVTYPLELTLELMPKADLLEKQKFVFLLLVKYLVSPGHYRIPIRGTLAKPSVF